eukprot:scaffold40046_cov161-Skeletonema_marinoi.AAC.1
MKSIETDDVSIISISVWDMGTYYRGVNPWFVAMKKIILEAAKKRRNKPLYVMNLHNIYASKCTLKNDNDQGRKALKLCQECNKMDAMFAFRDAIASAVRCAVKEDGYHNVYLIDKFGVTNSSFGEEHSDGVHFSSEVTQVLCYMTKLAGLDSQHHVFFQGKGERRKELRAVQHKRNTVGNRRQ